MARGAGEFSQDRRERFEIVRIIVLPPIDRCTGTRFRYERVAHQPYPVKFIFIRFMHVSEPIAAKSVSLSRARRNKMVEPTVITACTRLPMSYLQFRISVIASQIRELFMPS